MIFDSTIDATQDKHLRNQNKEKLNYYQKLNYQPETYY